MKFDEAVFRLDGVEEVILLDEIPRRDNFLEIIQNIYCPDPHCDARLVFNRRSTGKNYLSKHKSSDNDHDIDCDWYNDDVKTVKSITEYTTVNGGLTEEGKKRRKKEAMKALRDYLDPPEPKPKNPNKKPTPKKKTTESTETKRGIKVNYDPNGEVVQENTENGDFKVKEPSFYERLPHQLSVKDSGENLRTSAIIKEVKIFKSDNPQAEIKTVFGDIQITFVMPEPFFLGNERRLSVDQLIEYLEIIKKYVEAHPNEIYLTTMCQSRELDMEDIILYVLEPDFMSFQTKDGRDFETLTAVIAAISTGAI
ncbi:hypothetical protein JZO78_04355 [Enterococcus ureilyticus]|uniref:hypothetical protein n=1 Tax=Enterococcus ureilyticus TaxID=1131292 RepID=UPI001A9169D3|nr:hypothetical protein [Enterococcus ureilyticus]MBO0445567.1 hypothetical protein [Enterococcus ureilyticus]